MNQIIDALKGHPPVSGWKINIHKKESHELFFVKGKLETLRCTDTCDKLVTVYVQHGEYLGDSQFYVYPSTTPQQLDTLIQEAVSKALLINNPSYTLPGAETGEFRVESNFSDYESAELAAKIATTVFESNTLPNGSLNSVEIFINRHTDTICNSNGLHKTQIRYDAMVEAIPTYNGEAQSVELYEQYNFATLDEAALRGEIAGKMEEVKARFEAVTPASPINCRVILRPEELSQLFLSIAGDLNYESVYSHSNLFRKGDAVQKSRSGDPLGLIAAGEVPGCVYSRQFDNDGLCLASLPLVENGMAVNYFGSNRYGQYLGEAPTGNLWCFCVEPGTAEAEDFETGPYLEVVSMSGLQVDLHSDYLGGEVRLAYYHDGEKQIPVTGISIAGSVSGVLNTIRLSRETTVLGGYKGPAKAILTGMNIF